MSLSDPPSDTRPVRTVLLLDDGPLPALLDQLGAVASRQGTAVFDAVLLSGPLAGLAERLAAGTPPDAALRDWQEQVRAQQVVLEGLGDRHVVLLRESLPDDTARLRRLWPKATGSEDAQGARQAGPRPDALAALVLAQDPACLALAQAVAARCGAPPPPEPGDALVAMLAEWRQLEEAAARGCMETALARAAHQAERRSHARSLQRGRDREALLGGQLLAHAARADKARG